MDNIIKKLETPDTIKEKNTVTQETASITAASSTSTLGTALETETGGPDSPTSTDTGSDKPDDRLALLPQRSTPLSESAMAPMMPLSLFSSPELNYAVKAIIAAQNRPLSEKVKAALSQNKSALICGGIIAPSTMGTYVLTNYGNKAISLSERQINGVISGLVNTLFNSLYLPAVVKDLIKLLWVGGRGIAPSKREALVLVVTGLIIAGQSLSVSMPYPSSTYDGNKAAKAENADWPSWTVDAINNSYVIINTILYYPALFKAIKHMIWNKVFRSKDEKSWAQTQMKLLAEIEMALLSKDPKQIDAVYNKLKALDISSWEAFTGSAIRISKYNESKKSWGQLALNTISSPIVYCTAILLWFGTSPLIAQSLDVPGFWEGWTFLARKARADVAWVALLQNLPNLAFGITNGLEGVSKLSALTKRVIQNCDHGALGDIQFRLPVISDAADCLARIPVGKQVVGAFRRAPIINTMAFAAVIYIMYRSAGTSLAQAGDGINGTLFPVGEAGSWLISIGSAIDAFLVNSSQAAFPLYNLFFMIITLITTSVFIKPLSCFAKTEPVLVSLDEAQSFGLEQYKELLTSDAKSFDEKKGKTPFFVALESETSSYVPPAFTSSGSGAGAGASRGLPAPGTEVELEVMSTP